VNLNIKEKSSLDEIIIERISQLSENVQELSPLSLSDQAKLLNKGISGGTLKRVTSVIPRAIVIRTVGTDTTNLSKLYNKEHLTTWQSDGINCLSLIWLEVSMFFDYDLDDMNEWLATPLAALEGGTPESLMGTETGRKALNECLNRMRNGNF